MLRICFIRNQTEIIIQNYGNSVLSTLNFYVKTSDLCKTFQNRGIKIRLSDDF